MFLQTEQTISKLRARVRLYCTSVYLHCCTLEGSTLDHSQRHVIMFRPISTAASYDKYVYAQGLYSPWKVLELKHWDFQAWKALEKRQRSWKTLEKSWNSTEVVLEMLISSTSIANWRKKIHCKTLCAVYHLLDQFEFQKHLGLFAVIQLHW